MRQSSIWDSIDWAWLGRTKLIYRLIEKDALHAKRIAGRFAFDKAELDLLAANGDAKRGRGRPRKH
jgi:hypothetical protein